MHFVGAKNSSWFNRWLWCSLPAISREAISFYIEVYNSVHEFHLSAIVKINYAQR